MEPNYSFFTNHRSAPYRTLAVAIGCPKTTACRGHVPGISNEVNFLFFGSFEADVFEVMACTFALVENIGEKRPKFGYHVRTIRIIVIVNL